MLSRMLITALALICWCAVTLAQTTAAQQQARELTKKFQEAVAATAAETASVKLAENRALLQVSLAELLWAFDEPGARALIAEAQTTLSRPPQDPAVPEPIQARLAGHRQQLRGELVKSIARRAAQLALDFLRATRPDVKTSEEAAKQARAEEASLEQQLSLEIARHDPASALRLAEESLEKGFSFELRQLLAAVNEKDRAAGQKLAEQIRSKLQNTDLVTDSQAAHFALSLLHEEYRARRTLTRGEQVYGDKQRPPILSEQSLREWSEMMARAALALVNHLARSEGREQRQQSSILPFFVSLLPEMEKFSPAAAANFRRVYAKLSPQLDLMVRESVEQSNLLHNGKTEDFLALAAKASGPQRERYITDAIHKAVGFDADFDLARKLANEHISDSQLRQNQLNFIESVYTRYAAEQGNIDEVMNLLASLRSDEERIEVLAEAAEQRLKGGDKKQALELLDQAFSYLPAELETERHFVSMTRLIRALAPLDTARAFTLYESVLEPLNQIAPAYIKACRYNPFMGSCLVGKDELYIFPATSNAHFPLQGLAADLQTLAGLDFERALALADRFRQNELRLYAKLSALRGLAAKR